LLQGKGQHRVLVIGMLTIALAVPCFAAIPLDPGAEPMVWHLLGGSAILGILKWRRILELVQKYAGLGSPRLRGFLFSTVWGLMAVPLSLLLFEGRPLPRFNDIFLVGIALAVYFFSCEAAAYLLGVGILASAWILPPYGSLAVYGFSEWYRLISFTAVSVFMILLVNRIKTRRASAARAATATAGDQLPANG
jgi:hypothetical protein